MLGSWLRIFVLTALGFPIVSILINLTDTLNKLLDRGLTMQQIAVSYVYSIPENMFLVMPAAVLFATVFTVGAMGRHSELTAAKAGGQSFHRLMLPIFVAAVAASGLAFVVGELAPGATAKQQELQKARQARPTRLALQLRLPGATRAGSTPSARSTWRPASSSRCCSSAREPGSATRRW